MKKLIKQLFIIAMCTLTLSGCTGTNPDNSSSGSDTHFHNYLYVSETAPTCTKDVSRNTMNVIFVDSYLIPKKKKLH